MTYPEKMTVEEFRKAYSDSNAYERLLIYYFNTPGVRNSQAIDRLHIHCIFEDGFCSVFKQTIDDFEEVDVTFNDEFFFYLRELIEVAALNHGLLSNPIDDEEDNAIEEDPDWGLIFPYID